MAKLVKRVWAGDLKYKVDSFAGLYDYWPSLRAFGVMRPTDPKDRTDVEAGVDGVEVTDTDYRTCLTVLADGHEVEVKWDSEVEFELYQPEGDELKKTLRHYATPFASRW